MSISQLYRLQTPLVCIKFLTLEKPFTVSWHYWVKFNLYSLKKIFITYSLNSLFTFDLEAELFYGDSNYVFLYGMPFAVYNHAGVTHLISSLPLRTAGYHDILVSSHL